MRQVLFIQGGGQGTHDQWDDKLVASLRKELGGAYEVHYPRMPGEEDPRYARWSAAIAGALRSLREDAILVGHSVGGTVLLKTLADQPSMPAIGAIILIAAPFVGAGGWSSDDLRFAPNLGAQLPPKVPLHFFHGLADEVAPPSHADLYARAVAQAHVHRLPGRDHQFNNDLKEVARVIRSLPAAC